MYSLQIRGEIASTETFGRISHIFLGAVDSDPEASWKCAQSMIQAAVLFSLLALGKLNTKFSTSTSLAVCVMMESIFVFLAAFFGLLFGVESPQGDAS